MNTLSVCLIVKDEALTLKRALENAASIADEIVVVDTGSSDNSKQIAQKYANVYDFLWQDDFSAARNEGIKKCKCDLIMWLDADDVIPEETVQKILALKQSCSYDMVMLPYEVGNLRFFRERIFRNDGTHFFAGEVHEAIQPKGKIGYLDAPIVHDKKKPHDKYRNLRILQKVAAKRKLNDRELFYYVSELYFTGDESAKSELWRFMKFYGNEAQKGQAAVYLSYAAKSEKEIRSALIEGIEYVNSSDIFTLLGESYMRERLYYKAKNAFLCATVADEQIVFPVPDRRFYIPYIRLCKCYWMLGNKVAAKKYNDCVLNIRPTDPYALDNAKLFI